MCVLHPTTSEKSGANQKEKSDEDADAVFVESGPGQSHKGDLISRTIGCSGSGIYVRKGTIYMQMLLNLDRAKLKHRFYNINCLIGHFQ